MTVSDPASLERLYCRCEKYRVPAQDLLGFPTQHRDSRSAGTAFYRRLGRGRNLQFQDVRGRTSLLHVERRSCPVTRRVFPQLGAPSSISPGKWKTLQSTWPREHI